MNAHTRAGQTAASASRAARALRRHVALLEFALASLLRNRGKTAVLGAVLTLIVFLLASFGFLRASVRAEVSAMLADAPDLVVQRLVAGRQELMSSHAAAALQSIPGVARAQGRLWGYYYDASGGANYTVMVPHTAPPAEGETAIGAGVSRSRQGYSTDVLAFRSYDGKAVLLTVKAVMPERADLVAGDLVVVSERDYRSLFALPPDVVNDVAIALQPGADPATVRETLLRALPGARIVTRLEMQETASAFLDWRSGIAAVLILAMALGLIIVSADKPSALGVEEQQEIGILRALGWSASEVLTAKVWESAAVSIVALFVGGLAAYAHIYLWGAVCFMPVLQGWAVLAPHLVLAPRLDVSFMTLVAGATMLLPASGAFVSAYGPAMGDPDATIRE